jgi:hypothetical protein
MRSIGVLSLLLAVTAGCGASLKDLKARAAFDLQCKEPLTLTKLNDQSWGVSGCAKQATYVEHCVDPLQPECNWVLNSQIQQQAQAQP